MDAGIIWGRAGPLDSGAGRAVPLSWSADAMQRAELARALESVGPLLCLFPAQHAQPLSAWSRWCEVAPAAEIDSEGPWEALVFLDARGATCWQLGLLPDADYYAWERLLEGLPPRSASRRIGPHRPCTTWSRVRHLWRACALRLFDRGEGQLAASVAALSAAGRSVAAQVARRRRAQFVGD